MQASDERNDPLGGYIKKLASPKNDNGNGERTTVNKTERKTVPSENEELAWTKHVDHSGNSYLVLVNHAGRTIKAGEQIMFYYGRYTNAYLLQNYGFCYRDNRYDQYDVYLEMRPQSMTPPDILRFDINYDEVAEGIQ